MNKEINIKIPGQILDYVDTKEHLLDLFNYITNLQEENEKLEKLQDESVNYEIGLANIIYGVDDKEAQYKLYKLQREHIHKISILYGEDLWFTVENGCEDND